MSDKGRLCRGLFVAIGLAVAGCGDDTTTGGAGGESTGGNADGGAGTGGDASGGGGATSAGGVQEFCDALVEPFCNALFACCTDAAVLDEYGGTLEACRADFGATCVEELSSELDAAIAAGVTVLDAGRLAACTANLNAIETSCDQPTAVAFFLCISAFRGTVAPGEACGVIHNDISFVECDDGLCVGSVCEPFLESGAACDPGNDPVAFCNYTAGEWCNGASSTCAPRGEEGDECSEASGEEYQCLSLNCVVDTCEAPTSDGLCANAG